ncbi:DNA protection during starvation protein [Botrimarina colliarenosi]|uniref:DNA protection during starvation protein n=1 Tax=Botrimarina colliarenosi TaxID=2528001 RepID=A0A5C6AN12_9BACT|nr:DNA starvation/stationary phase protection protein Dps [Botrimarina colliarenosi]TWU00649.1 DNA protection during starvation protein [Botrimarina colliarenosi]
MKPLRRHVVEGADRTKTIESLQACLVDLIDLALQGKQAHWNVVGPNFRAVHLQLDEIIESARAASDEVAERIVTLGEPAEGRAAAVAAASRIDEFPAGLHSVSTVVTHVADRLEQTIAGLRKAIDAVEKTDPISQDLLIGVSATLEKHLWMVQAQEG